MAEIVAVRMENGVKFVQSELNPDPEHHNTHSGYCRTRESNQSRQAGFCITTQYTINKTDTL